MVYLVHHGDALGPLRDPQRPLSACGRRQVEWLSREAANRHTKPVVIWHSGKLRARQTAEAFWRACNPLAEFAATKWMQPGDPPRIADLLNVETRDVMLVGHMPHLDRLRRNLLTAPVGKPHPSAPESGLQTRAGLDQCGDDAERAFPLHGVVALRHTQAGWVELWRLTAPARTDLYFLTDPT